MAESGFKRRAKRLFMALSRSRLVTFGCNSSVPERNIALGYIFYILTGFAALLLPWCTYDGVEASVLDHLFTATSAVSTTGLATVDVPKVYTPLGMCVILFLIQLGGMGYMTISSYLMLHLTHRMSNRSRTVITAAIPTPYGMSLTSIISNVVHFTIAFEVLGFLSLWAAFACAGTDVPAWHALFITISSFCTAGFSTFSDSLCSFSGNVAVNAVVAILSYAGAMGFIVITDISRKVREGRRYRVTFTTRVIVTITCVMTLAGTALQLLFPAAAQGPSARVSVMEAFFQTMSAMTTVGYNTFDLATLAPISVLGLAVIMFIGASPSGTGGGVKCTTLSAVYAFVVSMLRGRKYVSLRGNRLPFYRVNSALTNILVYGVVLLTGTAVITMCSDFTFSQILFEAASALGTVGISLGITPLLDTGSKITIIVLMYIGRIGVLTLGAALMTHAVAAGEDYPQDLAV